jgi:anti-anti-sigma factor
LRGPGIVADTSELAMSYDSRWTGRLSVRHDAVMGIQVLAFEGALEASTAEQAHQYVTTAVERGAPLVFDLSTLRSVDAEGAQLLRRVLRELRDAGLPMAIVRASAPDVAAALDAARIDGEVRIEDGLSGAIEAVGPRWTPTSERWTPQPAEQIRPRRDRAS